jgi:hypothetical protein
VECPKLSLKVVSANFSLSPNLTRHSKFRVCVSKPRSHPFRPGPTMLPLRKSIPISDTANLATDLCIKGVFLEWLDGPGQRLHYVALYPTLRRGETRRRLRVSRSLPPSLVFSPSSPCGYCCGRMYGKRLSSRPVAQFTMLDLIGLAIRFAFAHRGCGGGRRGGG